MTKFDWCKIREKAVINNKNYADISICNLEYVPKKEIVFYKKVKSFNEMFHDEIVRVWFRGAPTWSEKIAFEYIDWFAEFVALFMFFIVLAIPITAFIGICEFIKKYYIQ